jgi:hypothetical protein
MSSKAIHSQQIKGCALLLMGRGKEVVLDTLQRLKKYNFRGAETLRKNLNAPFLLYHLKYLRLYFLSLYLKKFQYLVHGLCVVNIETTAFCNRKCHFCFNNDRFPRRKQG